MFRGFMKYPLSTEPADWINIRPDIIYQTHLWHNNCYSRYQRTNHHFLLDPMEKILIIGAFDRYNYGDLLFPLIIEKQLNTYGNKFQFEFYGLVDSDLSKEGGKATKGLRAFYQACENPNQQATVIVAGGEALGVTWNSLLAALNKPFQQIHKRHVRLSKWVDLNRMAKKILNGKTTLPFVFDKSDFPSVKNVILNSLGGSGVNKMLFDRFEMMRAKLEKVDYLAVRDELTVNNLAENGVKAQLYPDSAIFMSEFYPTEKLEKMVTPSVLQYIKANEGSYVFFQINKKTTLGKEEIIATELDRLYRENQVEICLCPIGKALNHDDHIALKQVQKHLTSPFAYFDADNIWDIMLLIARSKAYIGTSLHGAITAMSYGIPHVGLKVEKLDAYLKTWGAVGNRKAVDFDQIHSQYERVVDVQPSQYLESRDKQVAEIKKGFDQMVQIILKGK